MPMFERDDGEIYYEEYGEGYPVLALAPGWLRSSIARWPARPERPHSWADWPDILRTRYRVVVMDQRNAGRSRGAIEADHGWHTYAADQLALVDHLGLERFHVVGVCVGASFALRLCEIAPGRCTAAVLPQPIGLHPEFPTHFPDRFAIWAEEKLEQRPDLDPAALRAFGKNMFDGDFVYSVSRDFATTCNTPALVMPGNNAAHPAVIGHELAGLLPDCELVTEWQCPEFADQQRRSGVEFLDRHTPR